MEKSLSHLLRIYATLRESMKNILLTSGLRTPAKTTRTNIIKKKKNVKYLPKIPLNVFNWQRNETYCDQTTTGLGKLFSNHKLFLKALITRMAYFWTTCFLNLMRNQINGYSQNVLKSQIDFDGKLLFL